MAHLQTFQRKPFSRLEPETALLTMRSNPQLGVTDRNGFGLFLPFLGPRICH